MRKNAPGQIVLSLQFIARLTGCGRTQCPVSIKQFDSIIALCITRHVLSNTIALSNMPRGENDNLIHVPKEVGVVVTV